MITIRIFISSPGDVGPERVRMERIIGRLQEEYRGRVRLQPFFWEHEPMRATASFNDPRNIPLTSTFDVVVCILWSRLGTMLSDQFRRPDGRRYESGTVFEVETAMESFRKKRLPDLLVYRKVEPVSLPVDPEERASRLKQYEALENFVREWFFNADNTFRSALNDYKTLSQFEALVEKQLSRVVAEKVERLAPAAAGDQFDQRVGFGEYHRGNPFRGLAAFDFSDEAVFFGRIQSIEEVFNAMRRQAASGVALTIVHGGSGSGKSSLIKAGVAPLLLRPGVVEGIGLWRRACLVPAASARELGSLMRGLATALYETDALPELVRITNPDAFAETLENNPQAAVSSIAQALLAASQEVQSEEQLPAPPPSRLLLVIDQFEELFTDEESFPKAVRDAFAACILTLARSGVVWVVASLRGDYLPRLAELPELVETTRAGGQYQLLPPTPTDLSHIVRLPARVAGVVYEQDLKTGARLDDRLVTDARNAPDALPLLEFVLEELYERREGNVLTHAAFDKLGGLEGAIASQADDAFAAVQKQFPDAELALGRIARQLVTVSEDKDASPVRRVAIKETIAASSPAAKALLDALITSRLCIVNQATGAGTVVFVAHEALFRKWPRLEQVIAADRTFLLRRARANAAGAIWREKKSAGLKAGDYLWASGELLKEAQLLHAHSIDLADGERDFVEASLNEGKRRKLMLYSAIGLAAIFMIVISVVALTTKKQLSPVELAKLAELDRAKQLKSLREQIEAALASLPERIARQAPDPAKPKPANPDGEEEGIPGSEIPIMNKEVLSPLELLEMGRRLLALDKQDPLAWTALLRGMIEESGEDPAKLKKISDTFDEWNAAVPQQPAVAMELRAIHAWKRGKNKDGILLWQDYLRSSDIEPEAKKWVFELLSLYHLEQKDWRAAELLLTEWINWRDSAAARVRRATAWIRQLNFASAQTDLDAAKALDPDLAELRLRLPVIERVLGYREAIETAAREINQSPQEAAPRLRRAKMLFLAGEPKLAVADIESAAKKSAAGGPTVAIFRGIAASQAGEAVREESKVTVLRVWREQGQPFTQWIELRWPRLEKMLLMDLGIASGVGGVAALEERTWSLFFFGQHKLGLDDAEAILKKNPRSIDGTMARCAHTIYLGKFNEGLQLADQAIQTDARISGYWRFRGEALEGLQRFDEAVAALTRAIALEKAPIFYEIRARSYRATKKIKEAEADEATVIKLRRTNNQ